MPRCSAMKIEEHIEKWSKNGSLINSPVLDPECNGRTPLHKQVVDMLYNSTNGHVYNLSTTCLQFVRCKSATNEQKNARAQHLDMSRCWALILPLPDFSTACPCSGVWQPTSCTVVVVVVYLTTNQRHMGYLSSGNGHLAGIYSTP